MSAKPRSKISPVKRPTIRSTHLRVVVDSSSRTTRPNPAKWIAAILVIALMSYAWMVGRSYFSTPHDWDARLAVQQLATAFQNEGIEGYLLAKARLREEVRLGLRDTPTDSRHVQAENLAVYLFPDLLPETHFEKITSIEFFAPWIEAIEARPRSPQASEAFENLSLEIWNYENASKEEPQLSDLTSAFLETLQKLSRS